MTMQANAHQRQRRNMLRMHLAAAVLGTGMLFNAQPSHAIFGFGDIVFDPGAFYQMIVDYGQVITEYYERYEHYQKQVASMQAQISSAQNMLLSLGIKPGQQLQEVPANHLVKERCGNPPFSLAGLLGKIASPSATGNIREQQQIYCAGIQMMHNRKYNETVKFLGENLQHMENDITEMQNRNKTYTTDGDNNKGDQNADAVMAKMEARYKNWETQMLAYDNYIKALENNQRILAQMALKGKGDAIGKLVQTATLQTALSVGN